MNGLVIGFSLLVLWILGAPALLLVPLGVLLLANFPRAHLFLGDCGSLLLGTLMAIMAVKTRLPGSPNSFFLLFAYPMVDVLVVVWSRWRGGRPLGVGDRSHLHHRMLDICGRRPWLATPCLLAAAFGMRVLVELELLPIAYRWLGPLVFLVVVGIILRNHMAARPLIVVQWNEAGRSGEQ